MFLYYVLYPRLQRKIPTAFQRESSGFYYFSAEGVTTFHHVTGNRLGASIPAGTWALVASSTTFVQPAEYIRSEGSPFFVVQATSPRSIRWNSWIKEKAPVELFFMNPFTFPELQCG